MRLTDVRRNWDRLGHEDPMWAVLTSDEYRGNRWNVEEFFATGRHQIEQILAHAEALGHTVGSGAALDFGCGVGRLSLALAEHFSAVTGVDIAPSMIEQAQRFDAERGPKPSRCTFMLNDRSDLSRLPSDSFDLVYSEITLMHIDPRYTRGYLGEFLRIAKPDGLVVFQLPEVTQRQQLRDMVPESLVRWGNRIRTLRRPMMEVYGIQRADVEATIRRLGGWVLGVHDRGLEHQDMSSYRYYVSPSRREWPAGGLLWRPTAAEPA